MTDDISVVEAAKAEQEAARPVPTAANPNLPSPTPPPSSDGHPIVHAKKHGKGRWS